ncbi:hypothetical protein SDC9_129338 [bioreactor metagenome]|uniref:Uncharacterized protein n=1 Tax=bioreactor metagenome TaxID=1076179 RepID=A0A645CZC6_9ZZZZ
MDQVKVQIIQAKIVHGFLEMLQRAVVILYLCGQLACHKHFFAGNPEIADRFSDIFFIVIGMCRIDVRITVLQSHRNRFIGLFVRDLPCAETDGGNRYPIVKSEYIFVCHSITS